MRPRILVAIVVLAGACKGQLNPEYCATHLDDEDCRFGGVITVDAPPPECTKNDDCATNSVGHVCDTGREKCVECIADTGEKACIAKAMVCGPDEKCVGCIDDSDCGGGVCLPSQVCGDDTAILFAAPGGSGTGCERATPCTFKTAVEQLTAARHIIKLTTPQMPATTLYSGSPITINEPYGVQIIGTGASFKPNEEGPAITLEGVNIEILGLAIDGGEGSGVLCTKGAMTLRQMVVSNTGRYGVETTGCDATIERCRFSSNNSGGMSLTSGTIEARNNIVDRNGQGGSEGTSDGSVTIVNASGRFVFNTVALNLSRSGGGRTGGIKCSSSAAFAVKRNLDVGNGDGGETSVTSGLCTYVGNFDNKNVAPVKFVDTTSFKLTAASPKITVLDDPASTADCLMAGVYIDDYGGQVRPRPDFCDVGADELDPDP